MNSSLTNSSEDLRPRILFVDDEHGVLSSIQRLLQDESYDVLTAHDPMEALELLARQGEVQIIISDYRMPGMNGVEFLQQTISRWPDTRRVILSGYTDSEILMAAVNEGRIHRFISKPWDNDALRLVIEELLQEYFALLAIRSDIEALAQRNGVLAQTNQHLQSLLDTLLTTVRGDVSASALRNAAPSPDHSLFKKQLHIDLSNREFDVLCRIASGKQPKVIAQDLGVSIKTVSTYKKRISVKMGFTNDADMIRYVITNNLECKKNPTNG